RDGCEVFHDFAAALSSRPARLEWPTIAAPAPLLVQLPQVMSLSGGNAVPSACEPVRMSCMLGGSPFSVSAVSFVRLFAPCRSGASLATITPFTFVHGPLPMRSLAFTAPGP